MSPFACAVTVEAPGRIRRALADAFADLTGPPVMTLRIRRSGLRGWTCSTGDQSVAGDLGVGVHESLIDLNRLVAAEAVHAHTAVHAGCVARGGRAVALVGVSGSGKTTLAAAAVQGGWQYLADEVCAIEPGSLAVQPYPRPLGLRPASLRLLGIDPPAGPAALFAEVAPTRVSRLGAVAGPTPLGAVVFVEREVADSTVAEPATTALSPAEALVQLCHHSLRNPGSEVAVFRRLEAVARAVPAYTLHYRDAPAAVGVLGFLLDGR